MTFGEKIQGLRKKKGMPQEQLAEQITVSRQAVSKWELGESMPDIDNAVQIAKLFDVSMDYLLNEEIEINTIPSSKPKKDAEVRIKEAFTVAVCIGVIGLILSYVGWETRQTMLAVCIGLVLQIVGIAAFEIMVDKYDAYDTKLPKNKFYTVMCWLVAPFPIMFLCNKGFAFYPREISFVASLTAPIIVYFIMCTTITLILWRKRKTS